MHAREQLLGVFLLVLALASGAGAARYAYVHWQPDVVLDTDHCPLAPAGTWLVAFDITDLLPSQERERVLASLLSIAERMRQYDRLALHVITGRPEDSAAPWPLPGFPKGFRLCKPVDPNSVDPRVQNERLVRVAYEQDFLDPLRAVLPELVRGATADRSPILHAIEIMMWSPLFRPDSPNRTLVIFSDLLLHTRELSQLTQSLTDPCTTFASDIGLRLNARNWQGVRVILEYLRNPRDALRQSPEHLHFWSRLFYLLGAAEVFDGTRLVANDAACPALASSLTQTSQAHARSHRNR